MGTWYSKQQGCKDFPFNQVQMVAEIHHAISNESRHGKEAICTTRRACRADIPLWHLAMLPDYLLSDGGPNFRVRTYENLGIQPLIQPHIQWWWINLVDNLLYPILQPVFGWYIQHITGLLYAYYQQNPFLGDWYPHPSWPSRYHENRKKHKSFLYWVNNCWQWLIMVNYG